MHGLLTGQESRQQLYTMLTRGRHANHLYLQVVGDGDPHTLIRPDTISPRTPTETLQQILARDEAPVSASTLLRELNNPAARLFQAVQRYTDGLHVAAEQLVGPQTVAELDQADQYIPGLTTEPGLANAAGPPARVGGRNWKAPTPPHADSRQRTRPPNRRRHGRRPRTGASQRSRLPTQVRCPGSRAFHQRSIAIPSGGPTWQSDPNWSPTSPARFKITPAKVTPSLSGLHREVTRAPPSSAKSQCGAPPTASIPKTRDQPEEPQLETLPALWKQRLDRHIARSTDSSGNARLDERQAAHTALRRWHDDSQRLYRTPGQRPNGPAAPGR